jgi:hypothetical protein
MPTDTVVAAMINDTASAAVAMSSILSFRRLEIVLSAIGDVKPTTPVSPVMILILRESVCAVALSLATAAPVRPDFGEVIEK